MGQKVPRDTVLWKLCFKNYSVHSANGHSCSSFSLEKENGVVSLSHLLIHRQQLLPISQPSVSSKESVINYSSRLIILQNNFFFFFFLNSRGTKVDSWKIQSLEYAVVAIVFPEEIQTTRDCCLTYADIKSQEKSHQKILSYLWFL